MPTELYGTLYGHDNLYIVMTMLKDIYAKKPQPAMAAAATVGQQPKEPQPLSPSFSSPTKMSPQTPETPSLEERIAQLTETLYQMDYG